MQRWLVGWRSWLVRNSVRYIHSNLDSGKARIKRRQKTTKNSDKKAWGKERTKSPPYILFLHTDSRTTVRCHCFKSAGGKNDTFRCSTSNASTAAIVVHGVWFMSYVVVHIVYNSSKERTSIQLVVSVSVGFTWSMGKKNRWRESKPKPYPSTSLSISSHLSLDHPLFEPLPFSSSASASASSR